MRTIQTIEKDPNSYNYNNSLLTYKKRIEDNLQADCNKVINMIKEKVINNGRPATNEDRAFFLKMAGDYYCYIAQSTNGDRFETA